ncbi:hypothetical protein RF11_06939 [Thelohanellus kitauei]|uniref:Uncharacterized protein n=1 Tax=Thelohanellus kitauei TaxID=669202 RepID=A0A0C2MMP2_THEKT|nr:hypothetical protein RF11_06939 [Thelohanellus kitauei]
METVCVNNQVSYSYQLVPGISLQSYSFNVAKICGVPNGLLVKAQGVLNKLEGGQTLIQVMQNDQPQNVTNFKGFIREILSLSGEGEEFKTKLKAILDKYLNVV